MIARIKRHNRHKRGYSRFKRLLQGVRYNLKPKFIFLALPLAVGLGVLLAIYTGLYTHDLSSLGSQRLVTTNWSNAQSILTKAMPKYQPHGDAFTFYTLKYGQDLAGVARTYNLDATRLAALNPGLVAAGSVVRLPVSKGPLIDMVASSGQLSGANISQQNGIITVKNNFANRQPLAVTWPTLAQYLTRYGAIRQVDDNTYEVLKPISVEGDIRLTIGGAAKTRLLLDSSTSSQTCLCFKGSVVLFKNAAVTSYDPSTKRPDTTVSDGRASVRMLDGRMDIVNSQFSFLGSPQHKGIASGQAAVDTGRGVIWQTSDDNKTRNETTGWVEHSLFRNNYNGAVILGATGMTWRNNRFYRNISDGLLARNASNNMIVDDIFAANGANGLHIEMHSNHNFVHACQLVGNYAAGISVDKQANYNDIFGCQAYMNNDNFVVRSANFNRLRRNVSDQPRADNFRIKGTANDSFIENNEIYGGVRGIELSNGAMNGLITGNHLHASRRALFVSNGSHNTLFADNTVDSLAYILSPADHVIFGPNHIGRVKQAPVLPANMVETLPW